MKQIIFLILTIVTGHTFARNGIEKALSDIDHNNTTLSLMREAMKADKLANKTDIFLPDPEVGFNYLWGSLSVMGKRQDFSLSQTIDVPTVSGVKNRVADRKNDLLEWQYMADRMNIMLEAKLYLIDLIYYNSLLKELSVRKERAEAMVDGLKRRFDSGDANLPEYNNSCLELSKVCAEIQQAETEKKALLAQLCRLNGGVSLSFDSCRFEEAGLSENFDEWFQVAQEKNPVLAYVRGEVELSKQQLLLSKQQNLPSFSVGYMSEKTPGERYQGVSVGLSVPLWNSRNKIKQAKASLIAAEARKHDAAVQFYGQLSVLYQRVAGLQQAAETYRRSLEKNDNSHLLKKALDAGQLSVSDYLLQTAIYYDSVDKALSAERDFQKAFAELTAFEL